MTKHSLPKYVYSFSSKGRVYLYFQRKGFGRKRMPDDPSSTAFAKAYAQLRTASEGRLHRTSSPLTTGKTIRDAVLHWQQSPRFLKLKPNSKADYRASIERWVDEFGKFTFEDVKPRHVQEWVSERHATPTAANNFLKRLKQVVKVARLHGLLSHDPTDGVESFRVKSDGYHAWSEEEITRFEERHPVGTIPRLAFDLLLYTGQRRSDVPRMGWQHVFEDVIRVVQQKTGTRLAIPIHPKLWASLSTVPRDRMTFLITSKGQPFKIDKDGHAAGFGNKFGEWCREASVPGSAHGLRKAATRRLAELGCTDAEIMAVTGHATREEVTRYSASADQGRLARNAFARFKRAESPTP